MKKLSDEVHLAAQLQTPKIGVSQQSALAARMILHNVTVAITSLLVNKIEQNVCQIKWGMFGVHTIVVNWRRDSGAWLLGVQYDCI